MRVITYTSIYAGIFLIGDIVVGASDADLLGLGQHFGKWVACVHARVLRYENLGPGHRMPTNFRISLFI